MLLFRVFLVTVLHSPGSIFSVAIHSRVAAETVGCRRCVGQFLWNNYINSHCGSGDTLKADTDGNDTDSSSSSCSSSSSSSSSKSKSGKHQSPSVLDWLNEYTSCDSPSVPSTPLSSSYPSWKWKMKNLVPDNKNGDASNSTDGEDRPYHVVVPLMEHHPIHYEIITGLLVAGINVSIFYIQETNTFSDIDDDDDDVVDDDDEPQQLKNHNNTSEIILSNVFSRIPIYDNYLERARDSFTLIELELNEYYDTTDGTKMKNDHCRAHNRTTADHPLEKCEIQIAPSVFNLLQQNIKNYVNPIKGVEGKHNNMNSSDDKNNANDDSKHSSEFDFIMLMDASFHGGLLFSEINMIPTIATGSHRTLKLAVEQEPNWFPSPKQTKFNRLGSILRQRFYSIGLTSVFLRANKMRHSLGLQLQSLKCPIDCFISVVALLVDFVPSKDSLSSTLSPPNDNNSCSSTSKENYNSESRGGQRYANRVHQIEPFLSPCTPCLQQPASLNAERNANVIMVAPPAGKSAEWTRSLIRALTLARQSLEGYDECLFDRASCQNGVLGFEVDWLNTKKKGKEDNIDNFPPVVPSFIHNKISNNLLDSAIRSPNTIVALISCDSEPNVLTSFGIEVFCVSQSDRHIGDDFDGSAVNLNGRDPPSQLLLKSLNQKILDPEVIAIQLLKVLRRKSIGFAKSTTGTKHSLDKRNKEVATEVTDGLQRTLTIVLTAAQVHRETDWDSLQDMQRVTSKAIMDSINHIADINILKSQHTESYFDEQQSYDASTVFIAWLVFLSATIYIILKDSVLISRLRFHTNHHHHHHHRNGNSASDGILSSLSDLDDAWDTLLVWSNNVTESLFVDNNENLGTTESEADAVGGNTENEHHLQHDNNRNNHNHHGHGHGHMRRRRKTKTTR